MERRHIKWLPLLLAALFFAYQYFSSEKFVNPETGRKSHVAMSTGEEAVPWSSELSASPGTVGDDRFGPGARNGETSGMAVWLPRQAKPVQDFDWQVSLDSVFAKQTHSVCRAVRS